MCHARPLDDPFTDAFGHSHILKPLWLLGHKPRVDVRKNVWLRVGESETLFSCHYDTAHHKGGWQHLSYDEGTGLIWKNDNAPLGADDGGGIWVLLKLIAAGKPGLYIFHNGEERGCIGSKYIADKNPDLLKGIKRAIAFDRRGTRSVITEMSPGKVCSKEFALELAGRIGMDHEPDPTGSMTDTGQYRSIVPECTNVSVGYMNEHGPNETLDVSYLFDLVDQLYDVNFETLPTVRDPKVYEGRGYNPGYPIYSSAYERDGLKVWTKQAGQAHKAAADNEGLDTKISELLVELYGIAELPDPYQEPADFVWVCMEAIAYSTTFTKEEHELVENALYAYARQYPKQAKEDLLAALQGSEQLIF